MSISWNKQTNINSTLDKLYNSIEHTHLKPTKGYRDKSCYAFILYRIKDLTFYRIIKNTNADIAKENKNWNHRSCNRVSIDNINSPSAGRPCYGYYWRRQIKKGDPYPLYLDDALLDKYLSSRKTKI